MSSDAGSCRGNHFKQPPNTGSSPAMLNVLLFNYVLRMKFALASLPKCARNSLGDFVLGTRVCLDETDS